MVQISRTPPGVIKPQVAGSTPNLREELQQPKIDHAKEQYKTFSATLNDFLKDVNDLQEEYGRSVEKLLTGEIKDVHDVMVAAEKASTSFELMMELRNKMIDAYHEILRMQV